MVGLRAQSKSQARLHLISCLSFPCLQSIFAYYGSPNQSIVPSYSTYLVSGWLLLLLGQAGGRGATRCPGKSKRGLFFPEPEGRPGAVPDSFIFMPYGTTPRGTGTGEKEALRVDRAGTAGCAQNRQGRRGAEGKLQTLPED